MAAHWLSADIERIASNVDFAFYGCQPKSKRRWQQYGRTQPVSVRFDCCLGLVDVLDTVV